MDSALELLGRIKSPKVDVIGDVMVDRWLYGGHSRTTSEYGKPFNICDIISETESPGGAANVARNLQSLGANKPHLYGLVGCDYESELLKQLCWGHRISPQFCYEEGRRTVVKTRVIDSDCYFRFDREDREDPPSSVHESFERRLKRGRKPNVWIVSDYGKGFINRRVMELLLETKVPIVVDTKVKSPKIYKGATLIKLSEGDHPEVGEFVKVAPVVYTRSSSGLDLMYPDGKGITLSGWKVKCVDAIGAGDALVAMIGMALASGFNFHDACVLGNLAGAASVIMDGTLKAVTTDVMKLVINEDSRNRS